jgi:copper(I)-binding protein
MKHRAITQPTLALAAVVAAVLLAGPSLAAGEGASEQVHVMEPWSRELPPVAPNGAAYFQVANHGRADARIVGASSPIAKRAELHTHSMVDGVMRMGPVEGGVPVPAGGSVTFAPGGLHVMLMGLSTPLAAGMKFPLTLEFEDGGTKILEVGVLSMDEAAKRDSAAAGHGGHGQPKKASGG